MAARTFTMAEDAHPLELIDALPAIVWRGPAEAIGMSFVSRAAETILGYPRAAWLENPSFWREHVHPDDRTRVVALAAEAERARRPYTDEYRMLAADGRVVWLRETVHFLGGGERPVEILGVVTDVTQEKQTEESLRQSRERFELLSRATHDALWDWDIAAGTVWRSEGYAVFLGRRPQSDEPLQVWENLVDPRDLERVTASVRRATAGDASEWTAEYRLRRADGELIEVADRAFIVRDAAGRAVRMLGALSDISQRRQRERERETRLRRMSSLRSVDLAISGSHDLRLTSAVILEQMAGTLGLDAAAILTFDAESQTLRFGAGRGFLGPAILTSELRVGQSLAGEALLRRRAGIYSTLSDEQLAQDPRAAFYAAEKAVAYFVCPLVAKGRPVGVLEGLHRSTLPVDGEWREFFETLGGQAAIAVDNAMLFDGLQRSNAQLTLAYDSTIEGWSRALDLRDKETEGHSRRVTDLTLRLARALRLPESELVHVRRGALLHDIGKLGVPDAILLKPGTLDDEEWRIMRRHAELGRDLLAPIPHLRPALDIPYCHHEKWDGTGYPRGLRGEEIPLAARIFSVADVFDAAISDRPYRRGLPIADAVEYIASQSGRHFDPRVVEAFLATVSPTAGVP